MWRSSQLLFFCTAFCVGSLLTGCGGSGSDFGSGGRGTVQVFVTETQHPDIEQVELEISKIEAKRGEIWETIFPGSRTVQLINMSTNPTLLVTANLPPASYRAVRLTVTSARITDENGPHAAVVDTTPVTVPTSFSIHVAEVTPVTIGFDLGQSLSQNIDGTYRFDPVFSVSP